MQGRGVFYNDFLCPFKEIFAYPQVMKYSPTFFTKVCMSLVFTTKFTIYIKLILVYGIK